MPRLLLRGRACLRGKIDLPADKSISHRSIILSCLSEGKTTLKNIPSSQDVVRTLNAFKRLGIKITGKLLGSSNTLDVFGKGLYGLKRPEEGLFLGDSGTTFRLMMGVLAGQNFTSRLTAGRSLSARPMLRVALPLRLMGAFIKSGKKIGKEEFPPITIVGGGRLKPIVYKIPVASAQVKSALLLAGLYADGKTRISEVQKTRDHTERMLKVFKADIKVRANTIVINGRRPLVSPGVISVPADISSAAFFMVGACILKGSQILIKNVNLNPTRMGVINVLKRMGACVKVFPVKDKYLIEPAADIAVKAGPLKAVKIKKEEIPSLIDELPVLMVAACFAKGKSVFEGVTELRVKETDRIKSMVFNLKRMGALITVKTDRIKGKISELVIIQGVSRLKGARIKSFQDHRTAMSMIIAALAAEGKTEIDDVSCIDKSFPDFLKVLNSLF